MLVEDIEFDLSCMDVFGRMQISDGLEEQLYGYQHFSEEEKLVRLEQFTAIRYQAKYALDNEAPLEISIPINDKVSIEFVLIPPGEFLMGSPDDCPYASKDEKPQHRVRINNPFWMAKYPATQEQYEALIGTNPSHFKDEPNSPKHPVECVNWNDSRAFCDELTRLLPKELKGRKVRLPLEAEWEYACRAGSTTLFPWGDSCNGTQANVDGRHPLPAGSPKGPYLQQTCVVGSYKPNNFGLYDMIGQVWEWCEDGYDSKAYAKRAAKGIYIVGSEGEHRRPFDVLEEAPGTISSGSVVLCTATGSTPSTAATSSVSGSSSEGENSRPFDVSGEVHGTTSRRFVVRPTASSGSMPTTSTAMLASESSSEGEQSSPFVSREVLGSTASSTVVRTVDAGAMPTSSTTTSVSAQSSEGEESRPFVSGEEPGTTRLSITVPPNDSHSTMPPRLATTSASAPSSEGEQRSPFIISREVHGSTGRFVDQQADSLSMRGSVVTTATTTSDSAQSSEGEQSSPFVFEEAHGSTSLGAVFRHTETGTMTTAATSESDSARSSEGEQSRPFVVSGADHGTNYLPHAEPLTETVTAADGNIMTFSAHTSASDPSLEGEQSRPFDVCEDSLGSIARCSVFRHTAAVAMPNPATSSSVSAPSSDGEQAPRCIRGCSWLYLMGNCRSAFRDGYDALYLGYYCGLRPIIS